MPQRVQRAGRAGERGGRAIVVFQVRDKSGGAARSQGRLAGAAALGSPDVCLQPRLALCPPLNLLVKRAARERDREVRHRPTDGAPDPRLPPPGRMLPNVDQIIDNSLKTMSDKI